MPMAGASDVEAAVIGHGKVEGPFTEFADLDVERDPNLPIRVTVQFYKATSNGVVSAQDIADIRSQIDQVYAKADYVGSLVTEGNSGRPTEYEGDKVEPADWWEKFWQQYAAETGRGRDEVIAEFRRVNGTGWFPTTERQLADKAQTYNFPPISPLQARPQVRNTSLARSFAGRPSPVRNPWNHGSGRNLRPGPTRLAPDHRGR